MCLAHLAEESAEKDEEVESEDPSSLDGVTEEFMVHPARAMKDAQVEEKCWYHCSSLEHFIPNCPLVRALRVNMQLNHKEGTALKKGPSDESDHTKNPHKEASRHRMMHSDSFLESWSLSALVQGQECGQSENHQRELYGPPW